MRWVIYSYTYMPKFRNGISPKQKKFADAYLSSGNGTQAALQAYNTNQDSVAAQIASENLIKPEVTNYIQSVLSKKDLKVELIVERLLNEINDPEPVIRIKALELLGKHLRMFSDRPPDPLEVLDKVKGIGWGRITRSEDHDKVIETHSVTNKKAP